MTPLPKHIKTQEVRRATCRVTAVVPLCGVDAVLWLDQLMAEFERLDWNVAWHFNNISDELSLKAANFPRTVAYSWAAPGTVYTDYDRTWATELAEQAGSPWICCQDADETLELRAPEMLNRILTDRSIHIARWYNIWQVDPDGSLWIRTDTPFISHKTRFYPMTQGNCYFRRGLSTMYLRKFPPGDPRWDDLRIFHWGFSTPELRERHYQQWLGTSTTGKVNSEFWQLLVDPKWLAKVTLKKFDQDKTHTQFCTEP